MPVELVYLEGAVLPAGSVKTTACVGRRKTACDTCSYMKSTL